MGWLRDFMGAAEPPVPSFGRLAELCLDHQQWPEDSRPKPRSLSTLFSKLDRNQDLDWLRDRLAIQQVLADLLKRPLGDIRTAIGEVAHTRSTRFLRLTDVRYAREVDLLTEEPPPGIPRRAYEPPSWGPTWWLAPSGSGRSVVGLWLSARGLSHVAHITELADLERVPSRGPLFLEVGENEQGIVPELTSGHLKALRGEHRPICIAAAVPPPPELSVDLLVSPPPEDYLPELVDWVADHLDGTGHYVADRAEQWLRKVAVPAGAVRKWGDALGLLGMIDEITPRTLLAKSLDELGEFFVRSRIREANENTSMTPRLAEEAYSTLLQSAARTLAEGNDALSKPHLIDEWTALLSEQGADDSPDPQWFTTALRGALGNQISKRDLRRAARKLQPGAFALVRSLEAAGLLVRNAERQTRKDEGALRQLRPRWLVSLLESRASVQLLSHSPSEWGRVLLLGTRPGETVEALEQRAMSGDFEPFYRALDDLDSSLPEHVAALEGMVIALGLCEIRGADLPDDLLRDLLRETADTTMVIGDSIEPRTARRSEPKGKYTLLTWKLALCALCQKHPFPLPHVDPLRSSRPALRQHFAVSVLSHLAQENNLTTDETRASLTEKEAARCLSLLADVCLDKVPACIALAQTWEPPSEGQFLQAVSQCRLDILFQYGLLLGQSETFIFKRLWKVLLEHPNPDQFFESLSLKTRFWQAIGDAGLGQRVSAGCYVLWSALLPHQFDYFLSNHTGISLPAEAAATCPVQSAVACISAHGPLALSSESLRILIARQPGHFVPFLAEHLDHSEALNHLLLSCPASASLTFAQALPQGDELLRHEPKTVDLVRYFLKRAIDDRHPHFSEIYERLAAIESALWPLRKLP